MNDTISFAQNVFGDQKLCDIDCTVFRRDIDTRIVKETHQKMVCKRKIHQQIQEKNREHEKKMTFILE
jgi:hypothetical protein